MTQPWNKNIKRLLDIKPEGLDVDGLPAAMENFNTAWRDDPCPNTAVKAAVAEIAAAMGWTADEAAQAFAGFEDWVTEEATNKFKDGFVGSKQHLLFGHLVSEVLEISPIFAAMLSPTGGMVGPGKFSFHLKKGVLSWHGIPHDAGGYLCRMHEKDPGYEYIKPHNLPTCEDRALMGQATGIAFWFKLLKLSFLNFLAAADPTGLMPAPTADINDLFGIGPLAMDEPAAQPLPTDGILLNPAEIKFLKAVILYEYDENEADLIEKGRDSLFNRRLLTGTDEEGYEFDDELIMATAVYLQPQTMLEASLTALDDEGPMLRYYQSSEYMIEQSDITGDQIRIAGLRDAGHAGDRLQALLPLSPTDLDSMALSLTEDEFSSAVSSAETDPFDPNTPLGLDSAEARSAPSGAMSDLSSALSTQNRLGAIRVTQFDTDKEPTTEEIEFYKGAQATWLVSRSSGQSDQVAITLASPTTLTQRLGLTS